MADYGTAAVPGDWFADTLDPNAPPKMPPMKKPGLGTRFVDALAGMAGASIDREASYKKGWEDQTAFNSQYRLRSAQTENALAEAEKRRGESMRQSQINELVRKAQADPNYVPSMSDLLTLSTGAADFTQGALRDQERGFRGTLADPNAAPEAQFYAGQGVQGRVLPRIETAGGQNYNLATDPNMQAPTMTPLQEATVDATRALEGQRERPGASSTAVVVGGVLRDRNTGEVIGDASSYASTAEALARAKAAPGGAGGGKPLTEFQVKAMSQLSRMDRTEALLNSPEFASYSPALADVAVDKVPLAGNYAVSKAYQQYKQAAREWISGLLRLDSGAAVPDSEFKTYFATFFPQPGDGPETVAQKAEARAAATAALRAGLPQIAATIDASRPGAGAPAAGGAVDPRVKQYADQYLGGDVQKATTILRNRGAIP